MYRTYPSVTSYSSSLSSSRPSQTPQGESTDFPRIVVRIAPRKSLHPSTSWSESRVVCRASLALASIVRTSSPRRASSPHHLSIVSSSSSSSSFTRARPSFGRPCGSALRPDVRVGCRGVNATERMDRVGAPRALNPSDRSIERPDDDEDVVYVSLPRARVVHCRASRAFARVSRTRRSAGSSVFQVVFRFPSIGGGPDPLGVFRFLNRHGCVLFRDLGRSFLKKMSATRGCFSRGLFGFFGFLLVGV